MRPHRAGLVTAALAVSLAVVSPVRASVPGTITEQGRLFDSSGNPITGATTFVFSIYSAPTAGGTAIWTETQNITLDSGYFAAQLGEVTPLTTATFATAAGQAQNLYLGVKVNSDAEMTPRQPLSSVPYAMVADNAIGDITPHSVSVNGQTVINANGAWVGAAPSSAASASIMQTGTANGAVPISSTVSQAVPSNPAYRTYVSSLSIPVPAAATHCFVVANGAFCGADPTTNDGVAVAMAEGPVGTAFTDVAEGAGACYLSPRIANANCSSCVSTQVVAVSGGNTYQFGCDVTTFAAGASGQTGACQVSALCF